MLRDWFPKETDVIKCYEVKAREFVRGLLIGENSSGPVVKVFAADTVSLGQMEAVPCSMEMDGDTVALVFESIRLCSYVAIEVPDGSEASIIGVLYEPELAGEHLSEYLAERRIIFLGCARDCEQRLEGTVKVLQRLGKSFMSHEIVIYENDSRDKTRELLNKLSKTNRLTVIGSNELDALFPLRTERIAHARNSLLEWVRRNREIAPDYVCWADMDGVVLENFSDTGFYSCFKYPRAWEAVFPVTEKFYYDIWALRHSYICPDDYVKFMRSAPRSLGVNLAVAIGAYSRQLNLRSLEGWLKVDSAFGGMAIYRWESISDKRYVGVSDGDVVCEHVPLNLSVGKSGGRLYINPAFVVSYPDFERRRNLLQMAYSL
jgi:hypothetical protein